MKQRKENKLSASFGETPHKVTSKYGNEVTVMSPEGVSYRRNVTELKKYLTGSEESDQQDTGQDVVADRNAECQYRDPRGIHEAGSVKETARILKGL